MRRQDAGQLARTTLRPIKIAADKMAGPTLEEHFFHRVRLAIDLAVDHRVKRRFFRHRPQAGGNEHLSPQLSGALLPRFASRGGREWKVPVQIEQGPQAFVPRQLAGRQHPRRRGRGRLRGDAGGEENSAKQRDDDPQISATGRSHDGRLLFLVVHEGRLAGRDVAAGNRRHGTRRPLFYARQERLVQQARSLENALSTWRRSAALLAATVPEPGTIARPATGVFLLRITSGRFKEKYG